MKILVLSSDTQVRMLKALLVVESAKSRALLKQLQPTLSPDSTLYTLKELQMYQDLLEQLVRE